LVHGEDFQPIPTYTSFGYPLKLPDRSEATSLEAGFGIIARDGARGIVNRSPAIPEKNSGFSDVRTAMDLME
jgi:hypothetical protein